MIGDGNTYPLTLEVPDDEELEDDFIDKLAEIGVRIG